MPNACVFRVEGIPSGNNVLDPITQASGKRCDGLQPQPPPHSGPSTLFHIYIYIQALFWSVGGGGGGTAVPPKSWNEPAYIKTPPQIKKRQLKKKENKK